MEFQKIVNFLDALHDDKDLPRFVTKEWGEVYDQSGKSYSVNKGIRNKTSMLRSDLCDYSYAFIVAKGTITAAEKNTADDSEAPNNKAAIATATNRANNNEFWQKEVGF